MPPIGHLYQFCLCEHSTHTPLAPYDVACVWGQNQGETSSDMDLLTSSDMDLLTSSDYLSICWLSHKRIMLLLPMYSKVILMAMCIYICIYLLLLLFINVYSVYTMIQPYESHHRFATPVQPAVSAAGPDKLKVAMMQLSLNRKVVGHLS